MKPVYIDLHIHTSENPDDLNNAYDLECLKRKIEETAEGEHYLIALTDHNTINKAVYLKAVEMFDNIILGVELHVHNYDGQKPYHCHMYFKLEHINENTIDNLNRVLDKLYPKKVISEDAQVPRLEEIMKSFDAYEFVLLPHGGQSHSAFNDSIPAGVQFDNTLERSIYYNHFDGFTARSNVGLEKTLEYFDRLGIKDFVNLITASDNYSPQNYPSAKAKDASPFVKTWMLAKPTFNGLRLSLSESSRLKYDIKPDSWSECIQRVFLENDMIDIDVVLTPGLNVVIGGSSSGKSLLVDSLYHCIRNRIDESMYINTPYKIQNIEVTNPAGQIPHYLPQNFIVSLCDQKDRERNINEISILQRLFPSDSEERKGIADGLSELNSHRALMVQSVKDIEALQSELARIPKLSHLIVTDQIQDNPLKYILPDDKTIESFSYSEISCKKDCKDIDRIEAFLSHNPLIEHDATLTAKLKDELNLAKIRSTLENIVRQAIKKFEKEINDAQTAENMEITTKRRQFDDLLSCIKKYFKFYDQFFTSLRHISRFSLKLKTKEIDSMGHKLFIDNKFELTKDKFLEVVNGLLKSQFRISRFENITPEKLFSKYYSERPKVNGYDDFKKRIYACFVEMDKKSYRIITKDGKDFDKLSAGWKTSVILDLIFEWANDNAPLIIDQPEDNLATGYINTGLLAAIKKCKAKRQIILVSHNATIPMLGDAQNIVLCKNNDKKISIKSNALEGSIDGVDVVDLVADITDGGKASVKKRVKKYNLKRFRGPK